LLPLYLSSADESNMFFRNVSWLSRNFAALFVRRCDSFKY
jgi:hypothetical protein